MSHGFDEPRLLGWGGAQRWLRTTADEASIITAAEATGGHAKLFHNAERPKPARPSAAVAARLASELWWAFDPSAIFNPTLSLA